MEQRGFRQDELSRCRSVAAALMVGAMAVAGSDIAAAETELPGATQEEDFTALRSASPFARVLNPAETFSLRGVAKVGAVSVATLYNRESGKSFVVTPESVGEEGIRLVEIEAGEELEEVKARVSFAGEEVELGYDPQQFVSAPRQASSGKGKGDRNGDGERRRRPSKEEMDRYNALAPEKQKVFQDYLRHVVEKYPEMPREERANMLRGALIRLSDGRELDFKPPEPGASAGGQ